VRCSRCGVDVGNGDVQEAVKIVTTRPTDDGPVPVTYYLCREQPDGDRCESRVLTKKALRHHYEESA